MPQKGDLDYLWSDQLFFNFVPRKQHVENISQMYDKTAEDSVHEAVTRKQDQQILLKVQDPDLAAREAHYHATCRREYTREDDRHQQTIKDTKTIEEQASNKLDDIFSVHRSVWYAQNRLEIKRLPR